MKNRFKSLLAAVIAAVNVAALGSGLPTASAETADDACCGGVPQMSLEEYEAFWSQFPDRSEEEQIAVASTLPSVVDLSTSPYFPEDVGDQKDANNCTAWATTYYQYTFAANKLNGIETTESNAYSPRWTYNWMNGGGTDGITYDKAYSVLMRQGALTMAECPCYTSNDEYIRTIPTDTEAMVKALGTRVSYCGELVIDDRITSSTDTDLMVVKSYLNNGYILQVNLWNMLDYGITTGTVCSGQSAIIKGYGSGGAHAMSVVGYNDNIQCDINGDGKISYGEKGAFKLANSFGDKRDNAGFIWVMYDALNATSDYTSNDSRCPVFDYFAHLSGNRFNYIEVENYDVNLVALLEINTTNIYNYKFTTSRNGYTSFPNDSSKQNLCYNGEESNMVISNNVTSYNGIIPFDFGSLDDPASYFTGSTPYYWGLQMSVINRDASTETISSCIYADNLMNAIKTASMPSSYSATWYSSSAISLDLGDLNYDGSLTADDADLLLEFLTLISDLSDLQVHLADYNEDGKISMTDLTALNGALPASEQALLRESVAELYRSLPTEKQIEMNQVFTELQTALSVDLDLVTV